MIVKELDAFWSEGVLAKAGRSAEEQMAHYLRRSFAEDNSIMVFNGLRFEDGHDAAQIDHVVLHAYGLIIIESKSVSDKIQVNERGEWFRWYGRSQRGMASPILQAKLQADFLRQYLGRHPEILSRKTLHITTRVAISDRGVISRAKGVETPEVMKADQVPEDIREVLRAKKLLDALPKLASRAVAFAAGGVAPEKLTSGEQASLTTFFLQHHRPVGSNATSHGVSESKQPSSRPAMPATKHAPSTPPIACKACGGNNLSIEYGFSYYFKCHDCQGSTPIQIACGQCGGKEKVRKAGKEFFLECQPCHTSSLFYTNPV